MANQSEADPWSLAAIWRYPVKSMAGEEISTAKVTPRGLLGDRAYALADKDTNRAAAVRTWATSLLSYRATFVTEPEPDKPIPAVRISMPQGQIVASTDPGIDELFSGLYGRRLSLMASARDGLLVEFPKGTLGAAYSQTTEMPLASASPPGTFFDYACVHLIATPTLDFVQSMYPQEKVGVRRFRPNLVIRTDAAPFIENSWVGKTIAIGDEVRLRLSIPCPRCINITHAQTDLSRRPTLLRTIAQHNMLDLGDLGKLPCFGAYADVVSPGIIRNGDAVCFIEPDHMGGA